jgi:Permuted papain-like amidase enzyme, YaeF/YiiX, C92 family
MVSRIVRKLHKGIMKASKNRLGNFVVRRVSKRKGFYLLHYPNDLRDLRRKLLPGDVLLVDGDHGISDWIKIYSSHTWSHCAIFVGEQFRWGVTYPKVFAEDQPNLVEAIMGKGVILGNLEKYENCNLRICRPRNLTRSQRETVIRWVLSKVGLPYDLENVLQFVGLPFDETMPPTSDIGESGSAGYTCSSLLAAAFGQVGLDVLHYYDKKAKVVVPYHCSQVQPKDFDLSPNFDIIKIYPAAYRKPSRPFRSWFARQKTA